MEVGKKQEDLTWLIKWGKKWLTQVYLVDYKDYSLPT
jgi:hypothetical protein